jgi:hypothetical protein
MSARRHFRMRLEDLAEQQAAYTNARARRAHRRQQERRDPPQEGPDDGDPAPEHTPTPGERNEHP